MEGNLVRKRTDLVLSQPAKRVEIFVEEDVEGVGVVIAWLVALDVVKDVTVEDDGVASDNEVAAKKSIGSDAEACEAEHHARAGFSGVFFDDAFDDAEKGSIIGRAVEITHEGRVHEGRVVQFRHKGEGRLEGGCGVWPFMDPVFLATRGGRDVAHAQRTGNSWRVDAVLAGARIRALHASGPDVWAGGDGLWRSSDSGRSWKRAGFEGHTVTAVAGRGSRLVVGLKPAAVAVSEDAGLTWQNMRLPRAWWWFTPSERPISPYVQALALSEESIVAGIEVGGIVVSQDGGASWRRAKGAILDCHGLASDPRDPLCFWQAGAGTSHAATTRDGGLTWKKVGGLRSHPYGWAVVADPITAGACYLSSSTGPRSAHGAGDAKAVISRGRDGFATRQGPPFGSMPYGLAVHGGRLFAACADGTVAVSDDGSSWVRLDVDLGTVERSFAIASSPS